MPSDAGRGLAGGHGADVLARLDVGDIEPDTLVAAADHVAAVPAEADSLDAALHARQRAPAHPVRRVPQADERVRPADRQVPTRGRELEAEAGRRVRVQRVQRC